jgi:soluble lytic murein transglycosylase-like protein
MSNITINSIPKAIKSISKEEWLVGGAVFLIVYLLVSKFRKKPEFPNAPSNTKPNRMVIDDPTVSRREYPSDIEEQFKKVAGSAYQPFLEDLKAIGLDKEIAIRQIWMESTFNPKAVSRRGAKGLTQFIDSTWATYGGGGDPFKVSDSLKAYPKFMKDLMKSFPDRIDLVLAGYNSGAYIRDPADKSKYVYEEAFKNKTPFSSYKGKIPKETQKYVASILQP